MISFVLIVETIIFLLYFRKLKLSEKSSCELLHDKHQAALKSIERDKDNIEPWFQKIDDYSEIISSSTAEYQDKQNIGAAKTKKLLQNFQSMNTDISSTIERYKKKIIAIDIKNKSSQKYLSAQGLAVADMTNSIDTLADLKALFIGLKTFTAEIKNLSDKYKLLSFNAAIAAERMGAKGSGLVVVANSFIDLSAASQKVVQDTAKLIEEVQEKTTLFLEEINDNVILYQCLNERINKYSMDFNISIEKMLNLVEEITRDNNYNRTVIFKVLDDLSGFITSIHSVNDFYDDLTPPLRKLDENNKEAA
ncbi:MAG: hypothetical protein CMP10_19510 [Zetaproteobacteria bacterium]|nr:hypothetical protein [Pseudobdellovibrionaceae bacterium]